jgi:hypothetical protein
METIFLFCFVFGALFTVVSALLGFAGSIFTHMPGGEIHVGHGHELQVGHAQHGATPSHAANGSGHHDLTHAAEHADQHAEPRLFSHLPLLNVSALLAFLTAFGATGFILMHYSGWPALWATLVAIVPGILADILIALLLAKILAGESVMRTVDYELEGTMGRVTVGIPAGGVGEIVFSKQGTRRSEAARSLGAKPIPYNTEVVIVEYDHGTALVQPYDEFVDRYERELPSPKDPASAGDA